MIFVTTMAQISFGQAVDFGKQIFPLLQKNCLACHNLKDAEGGVVLESHAGLMKGGDNGAMVVASKSAESKLLGLLNGSQEPVMPPDGNSVGAKRFTPEEFELIKRWIDEGAAPGSMVSGPSIAWSPIPGSLKPIYAAAASSDGQYIAAGRANQLVVYRWPALTGKAQGSLLIDPAVKAVVQADATHLDLIQSLAFSPDGTRLASGGFRDIKIWRRTNDLMPPEQTPFGGGAATTIAVSADGKWLAKGTPQNNVELWDVTTGQVKATLTGHAAPLVSIAWNQDQTRLLTSDAAGKLVIWGIAADTNGAIPSEKGIHVHMSPVPLRNVVWCNPSFIAGTTPEKKIAVWKLGPIADPAMPAPLEALPILVDIADIQGLGALPTDPPRLLIASGDGNIRVAQVPGGEIVATLSHGAPIKSFAVSPDRTRAASLGADGATKFWNVADGAMLFEAKEDHRIQRSLLVANRDVVRQKGKVDRLTAKVPELEKAKQAEIDAKTKLQEVRNKSAEALTAKVNEVAVATKAMTDSEAGVNAAKQAIEEAMKKLEAANKDFEDKKVAVQKAEKAKVEAEMEVMKRDQTLVAADEAIKRATDAIPAQQAEVQQETVVLTTQQQRLDQVKAQAVIAAPVAAQFTADSKSLFALHADQTVRMTRLEKGKPESVMTGIAVAEASIAALPDGRILAAAADGQYRSWNIANQWVLEATIGNATESPLSDRVTALDFSPDGTMLLAGSGPPSRFGELKVFSTTNWGLVKDFGECHSDTILTAKFSPDSRTIATGAADKIIRLHDVASGKFIRTLEGHTHHVLALAWQDDGQTIASGSADNSVKIWDVATGQQNRTINGFGKEVTSIAFVGQTNQILTSCADRQTRLHDSGNGNGLRTFGGAADSLYSVGIAEDGPYVISGGQDGKLWIWQLDNAQALQQLD